MTAAVLEDSPATYMAPWGNLGTDLSGSKNVAAALKKAGLDWNVSKVPAYRLGEDGVTAEEVPDHFFTQRDTDRKILGAVRQPYVVYQNEELFAFANDMVKDGSLEMVSGIPLKGGKVVALNFKRPEGLLIGGEDRVDLYLVISTSHDGSRALNCMATPIRVICMNTLIMATAAAEYQWRLTHTSTLAGRIAEAQQTMKLTNEYGEGFKAQAEKLLSTKLSEKTFERLLDEVIPVTPKVDEVLETIKSLYTKSSVNGYTGTAWGGLNAVTEYYDHLRDNRSQEALFTQVTRGKPAQIRQNLATRLLALA